MSTIQNLRMSLDRNWRLVCSVVGDAISGAKFATFPFPLPPASGGDGLVHQRLALLWSFSVPLFCEQPSVCLDWLIFSLSLAIPQFKLLSHESSLQLLSGPSVPVLTLSNVPAPLRLAPICWWLMQASGVLFSWELLLDT